MKPFDLEAAKANKPVQTRDGKKARIICFDKRNEQCPIVALVEDEDGREYARSYTNSGKWFGDDCSNKHDLFMASEKKEGWINIYTDNHGVKRVSGVFFDDYDALNEPESVRDIATIKIEWEE